MQEKKQLQKLSVKEWTEKQLKTKNIHNKQQMKWKQVNMLLKWREKYLNKEKHSEAWSWKKMKSQLIKTQTKT